MAGIWVPGPRWRSTPPPGTKLDKRHPLGAVLDHVWYGSDPTDSESGISGSSPATAILNASGSLGHGWGRNTSGGAFAHAFRRTRSISAGSVDSPLIGVSLYRAQSSGVSVSLGNSGGTANNCTINYSGTNNLSLVIRGSGGVQQTLATGALSPAPNNLHEICVWKVYSSVDYRLYYRGSQYSGTVDAGSPILLNRMLNIGANTGVQLLLAYGFGRDLPDDYLRALSQADPASLFEMFEPRQFYFPKPATGGATQTVLLGQVSETDTSQVLSVISIVRPVIGQASETDTPQALSVISVVRPVIDQVTESDLAQSVAMQTSLSTSIGQVASTETAATLVVQTTNTIALSVALETDIAQTVLPNQPGTFTAPTESDESQTLVVRSTVVTSIAQVQGTEFAQTLTPILITNAGISMALEIDLAQSIASTGAQTVAISQVSEIDTCEGLAIVSVMGAVQSTDVAQPFTPVLVTSAGVGIALEIDMVQAMSSIVDQLQTIGQLTELDIAQTLVARTAAGFDVCKLVTATSIIDRKFAVSIVNPNVVAKLYNRLQ